jgi:hypothetical protein
MPTRTSKTRKQYVSHDYPTELNLPHRHERTGVLDLAQLEEEEGD